MTQHAQRRRQNVPVVVLALPFAYREGLDEYNGVMRYLRETGTSWDLRIIRHSFDASVFADGSVANVDGVICGMDFRQGIVCYEPRFSEEALELLVRNDIPVVGLDIPSVCCRSGGKSARCAFLSVDSALIGRKAAQYLVGTGAYASFGFVGTFADRAWSRDRGAFFARELRRLGHRKLSIFQGDVRKGGDALTAWLRELSPPAAVFAANDHCAAALLRTCADAGIRVPQDIAVLGVDDDPVFCIHTQPTLSSLHPDFEAEGYLAAKTLAAFLARKRPSWKLVVGGTIAVTARMSTAPSSLTGQLVRRADEIISERACLGLNSDMLASMLGISRRLLDLRYRQVNGRSVRTAIESVRLARVKRLLTDTRLSLREIARACAFSSESYLEKVFLRRFGKPMGKFRQTGQ